jgi:hypothetical protein
MKFDFTICVNFIRRDGFCIQAMHIDRRTMLGPPIRVQSGETLRRLLSYLGATPAQLAEFDNCHRRWGQGIVHAGAWAQESAAITALIALALIPRRQWHQLTRVRHATSRAQWPGAMLRTCLFTPQDAR